MSAEIRTLPPRRPRPAPARGGEHPHVYTAVLIRDDVSVGEMMHALRFSGIVITTDPLSGQVVIHRSPTPRPAA
jgi:hypothetical protein